MATYPAAELRLGALIDAMFASPPKGAIQDRGFLGSNLEEAAESLAASVIENYTSIADSRTRGDITVWKTFDSDWQMLDVDVRVTIVSGTATRSLALKAKVSCAKDRWALDLNDWTSLGSLIISYHGDSEATTDPLGNPAVLFTVDKPAPSDSGSGPPSSSKRPKVA